MSLSENQREILNTKIATCEQYLESGLATKEQALLALSTIADCNTMQEILNNGNQ